MEFNTEFSTWETLLHELRALQQTFIDALINQITLTNRFRKKHLAGQQIVPPSPLELETCYGEFIISFANQLATIHSGAMTQDICHKIKPWAFFVVYGLQVYYDCKRDK